MHRFAAEEQIAGDIDRVAEDEILIDHLDMAAARIGGRRRSAPAAPSIAIVPASGM